MAVCSIKVMGCLLRSAQAEALVLLLPSDLDIAMDMTRSLPAKG